MAAAGAVGQRAVKKKVARGGRSAVSLSEFIKQHHEKIIEEWVAFARTLEPWAVGLSKKDLTDHAEELLAAIVDDMASSQSSDQQAQKSKGQDDEGALGGIGKKHAIDRLEGGLKLDQLVSEYRALRANVLRMWEKAQAGHQDIEITRFNEAIDETLAASAIWHTEHMRQTREQFLAILSHDLRTPLQSIVMGATFLTMSESLDVKQVGVAARIRNSGERMNRMVNDLLDLARTRLGAGIPVTPKAMDLRLVCQQVVAELEAVHPDRRLQLEAEGDVHGEWDGDRLNQVITNLVANALQYGSEDQPVTVAARAHGDDAVIVRVHNEGRPIAAALLKTIFEPMVRQPPTQNGGKNPGGLGLGLYIVQQVVTAHGGTIDVTSTAKEGTTFTVQLPRHPPKGARRGGGW